jgi:hypothetical protein
LQLQHCLFWWHSSKNVTPFTVLGNAVRGWGVFLDSQPRQQHLMPRTVTPGPRWLSCSLSQRSHGCHAQPQFRIQRLPSSSEWRGGAGSTLVGALEEGAHAASRRRFALVLMGRVVCSLTSLASQRLVPAVRLSARVRAPAIVSMRCRLQAPALGGRVEQRWPLDLSCCAA